MPKTTSRSLVSRLLSFLSGEWCFRLIMVFFVAEALWIALSGLYPMAFDEQFHFGLIQLYAHHPSPFWGSQPAGADAFGAIARDPSYLFQWLMSFPYHLVSLITSDRTIQVMVLRLVNIGLFAAALPLYRRLLLKTGASRAVIHLCLALFVLIPIVPLLAAQINYDNLFMPLTALSLLLALDVREKIAGGRLALKSLLWLAIVTTLACLVKYPFLPVALVIVVFLALSFRQAYRGKGGLASDISAGWKRLGPSRWLLVGLLVVSLGLFVQRYGVNFARYHKPVPRCDSVLTTDQCRANGPWRRNHEYAQAKPADAETSPLVFTADWFYGMWLRTFFAVDGPMTGYQTRGPLVLPSISAIVFSVAALAATLACWPKVLKRYDRRVIWLFVSLLAVYGAALWLNGYQSFLQTGRAVAINGRYLLPVLPFLLVILALGANTYLKSRRIKLWWAGLALVCMFWGGGTLTYILRSNDAWYWPDSPLAGANQALRDSVGPLVPGNSDPSAFMGGGK